MSQWRKKSKRGVSPIIATILLVAITVVLAAVLYVLISGLTRGPGNTPLGSAMAVSTATAGSSYTQSTTYFPETVSIQTASSGVTAQSFKLQLVNSAGAIQAFTAVGLIDVSGCWVGTFVTGTGWATGVGTLTSGASGTGLPAGGAACAGGVPGLTSQVSSGDQLVLITTSNIAAQGYALNLLGSGSYSGSVAAAIK